MNSIEEKSSNWLSLLSKYLKLASLRPKNGLLLEWFEEFQAQKILYSLYLALKSACFFCILIYFFLYLSCISRTTHSQACKLLDEWRRDGLPGGFLYFN